MCSTVYYSIYFFYHHIYFKINILNGVEVPDVTIFHDHSKYVICIKWSPNGSHFATVSYDKTVNLYKKR